MGILTLYWQILTLTIQNISYVPTTSIYPQQCSNHQWRSSLVSLGKVGQLEDSFIVESVNLQIASWTATWYDQILSLMGIATIMIHYDHDGSVGFSIEWWQKVPGKFMDKTPPLPLRAKHKTTLWFLWSCDPAANMVAWGEAKQHPKPPLATAPLIQGTAWLCCFKVPPRRYTKSEYIHAWGCCQPSKHDHFHGEIRAISRPHRFSTIQSKGIEQQQSTTIISIEKVGGTWVQHSCTNHHKPISVKWGKLVIWLSQVGRVASSDFGASFPVFASPPTTLLMLPGHDLRESRSSF